MGLGAFPAFLRFQREIMVLYHRYWESRDLASVWNIKYYYGAVH